MITRHTATAFQRRPLDLHLSATLLSVTLLSAPGLVSCASAPSRAPRPAASAATTDPAPGFLRQFAQTNRFRSGRPGSFAITPDGGTVFFLRSGPRDRVQQLWSYSVADGSERLRLTAQQLLGSGDESLSPEEKARRERARQTARGIASFQLSKDGLTLLVPLSGRLFTTAIATDSPVRELKPSIENAPPPLDPRFSPDGRKVAFVRAGDLWVVDVASGTETRLTTGATDTVTHGDAEFVAQEEMGRSHGFWWSPDSAYIAYQRTDNSNVEEVFISDPLNPFNQPQSWRYPRAGQTNATVTLGVVPVTGGETTWLPWDAAQFPYLATVKWEKQRGLYVLVQNRLQTEHRLLRFDPRTWQPTLLLTETDPAWINLDQDMPAFSDDLPGFFWTTESAGWTDLEWRMEPAGDRRLLVGGEFNYRSLVKVEPARRETLVTASADPTQTHLYSLRYEEGEMTPTCLTCERPGLHTATVSKDGSTLVLTSQPQEGQVTAEVYRRAAGERGLGKLVGTIRSEAELPLSEPKVEWTTVEGSALWHAAILRPASFRRGQSYPVICSVYTGPTAQTVTRASIGYALQQWIADHGFIVVSIDNRGTPGRGRSWERLTRGNLIDLQLADQTEALTLLGNAYPELDMNRVGVFGWSFGGYYAAMAACRRPDVYKAACAGAPAADWADYDTHYTERYLGLPADNADGYRASNVLTYIGDLKTPMLLIHGSADDNVYFTHSLKIMEQAVREGVSEQIEFMPLAGQTHVVVDPDVVERLYGRMMRFFAQKLAAPAR